MVTVCTENKGKLLQVFVFQANCFDVVLVYWTVLYWKRRLKISSLLYACAD